jgi:hypothetical protein
MMADEEDNKSRNKDGMSRNTIDDMDPISFDIKDRVFVRNKKGRVTTQQ